MLTNGSADSFIVGRREDKISAYDRSVYACYLAIRFDFSAAETSVLQVLLRFANSETLQFWPRKTTIAYESRASRATVYRFLDRLVDMELLSVVKHPDNGNRSAFQFLHPYFVHRAGPLMDELPYAEWHRYQRENYEACDHDTEDVPIGYAEYLTALAETEAKAQAKEGRKLELA